MLKQSGRGPDLRAASVSPDKPDPLMDALWLKEAECRMAAYRAGEPDAVDAGAVFANLGGHA